MAGVECRTLDGFVRADVIQRVEEVYCDYGEARWFELYRATFLRRARRGRIYDHPENLSEAFVRYAGQDLAWRCPALHGDLDFHREFGGLIEQAQGDC